MNINYLVENFKANSTSFYNDLALQNIDAKHEKIISNAYKQIEKIDSNTFRSWSDQNDLDCPKQLQLKRGFFRGLIHPLYYKLFKSKKEALLLQALKDDIGIINLIGGLSLMQDNPVDKSLGVSNFYSILDTTVNFRWLRYIYLSKRIFDAEILKKDSIWVDIGSYYGGLQGIIKKYNPEVRIVLVDFQHQLCRSYIYLSNLYPEAIHLLPNEVDNIKSFDALPRGSITYVPAGKFSQISSFKADLVSNFFSFGEMTTKVFNDYFNSDLVSKSRYLYLVNRFVSGPFFERTYDTDLNILAYIKKDRFTDYFDVFPMHHYMLMNRDLFKSNGFRNTSSSYFEYLSSIK